MIKYDLPPDAVPKCDERNFTSSFTDCEWGHKGLGSGHAGEENTRVGWEWRKRRRARSSDRQDETEKANRDCHTALSSYPFLFQGSLTTLFLGIKWDVHL